MESETQDSKPGTRPSVWWPCSTPGRVAFIALLIAAFFAGVFGEMSHRLGREALTTPIGTLLRIITPMDFAVGLATAGIWWLIIAGIRSGVVKTILTIIKKL